MWQRRQQPQPEPREHERREKRRGVASGDVEYHMLLPAATIRCRLRPLQSLADLLVGEVVGPSVSPRSGSCA